MTDLNTPRRSSLSALAIPLVPVLVLVAYFIWSDLLLLRLAAVAVVLAAGDLMLQDLSERIISRGRSQGFDLHFGQLLFIVVVGTVLSIWWGWRSTAIVLFVHAVWQVVASLWTRKLFENPPQVEE